MLRLLIATTNEGKVREIRSALNNLPIEVLSLNNFVQELKNGFKVIENGKTFVENSVIKAKAYGEKLKILAIADDSGLEVEALDGRPGVFSKRYGNSDTERNKKLLKELQIVPEEKRKARFVCVLSIYDPFTKKIHNVEGIMRGKISFELKGNKGFGYDPIFINETGKTNAEISLKKKNQISHRGKAIQKLKEYLQRKYKV